MLLSLFFCRTWSGSAGFWFQLVLERTLWWTCWEPMWDGTEYLRVVLDMWLKSSPEQRNLHELKHLSEGTADPVTLCWTFLLWMFKSTELCSQNRQRCRSLLQEVQVTSPELKSLTSGGAWTQSRPKIWWTHQWLMWSAEYFHKCSDVTFHGSVFDIWRASRRLWCFSYTIRILPFLGLSVFYGLEDDPWTFWRERKLRFSSWSLANHRCRQRMPDWSKNTSTCPHMKRFEVKGQSD